MSHEPAKYDAPACDFEYAFKFRKSNGNFEQLWQMKASARMSLKDWLVASEIPSAISEICANACSELIENCIKYARMDSIATVAIGVANTVIHVETVNAAEQAHRRVLKESIERLNITRDPKQIFIEKLLHPDEGSSHLGLVKIVMETKGKLDLVDNVDPERVHVRLCMETQ